MRNVGKRVFPQEACLAVSRGLTTSWEQRGPTWGTNVAANQGGSSKGRKLSGHTKFDAKPSGVIELARGVSGGLALVVPSGYGKWFGELRAELRAELGQTRRACRASQLDRRATLLVWVGRVGEDKVGAALVRAGRSPDGSPDGSPDETV
ncbi:hypothetical protein UVI_02045410 [Ustilaginoidea virens]|uniref:Uncharacterized protein n=1 Tax=Ustilaginoidea virens TaxID=1159556 RepID=A0A1B5KYL8_USTVR|nr:hypothetical protein UVI_02045410 [Ustilaginoidea virens]